MEKRRVYMHIPPKYSVRNILIDNNWEIYKINHPELDRYIINEVEKMLDCCNPEKGFFYGYCENCKKEIIMHIKCNGKVCSRCGKQYVDRWVDKAKKKIFNEPHKLVSLTIPADLRSIFAGRWDLLQLLQDSAYET
ncbi:MAG: transposase zinc-binding domain-containing protein, partial [Nanoarchaeota archaeon]|nr:transposase zinc-binding domain-containing protein [Nanoarchaeota archaeon]